MTITKEPTIAKHMVSAAPRDSFYAYVTGSKADWIEAHGPVEFVLHCPVVGTLHQWEKAGATITASGGVCVGGELASEVRT